MEGSEVVRYSKILITILMIIVFSINITVNAEVSDTKGHWSESSGWNGIKYYSDFYGVLDYGGM